tara:strand:+ start:3307 stop:4368 length:1062 start_codon:yes stop_codon:yes gene_type:complete
MEKKLKKLSVLTVVLIALSIFTYIEDHRRGTGLALGSDFIAGFDVDKVAKLVIEELGDNNKSHKVSLLKEGESFVLEDYFAYPASNEKINDLLYKIANIQITQKVSEKKSSHLEYDLTKKKSKIRVSGFDRTGSKTFDFYVGKKKKYNGSFIRFADKNPVYLSSNALYISGEKDSYIETELMNVGKKDFEGMSLISSGKKLSFEKIGSEISYKSNNLTSVNLDEKSKEKLLDFVEGTQPIHFNDFKPIDFKDLADLKFDLKLELKSKNKMIYDLQFSKGKGDYYLKISSRLEDVPDKIVISKDDDKKKLAGVEDLLKAQKEVNQFNLSNSRWIFKVDKTTYEDIENFLKDFKS